MNAVKPKSLSPIQFEITPSARRDGFVLSSSMLLFPLWFPTFDAGMGYARFLARQSGCDVRVNNSDGSQMEVVEVRFKRGIRSVELQASNLELRQQIATMTRLEWELLETNERDNRRFGWDLHEDLGQQLAGITFLASLLAKQLESNCPALGSELGELVGQLRLAISNTRNIARGLYPIGLENGGLLMVLEEFTAWVTQMEKIPCEFRNKLPPGFEGFPEARRLSIDESPGVEVPKESAIHLYRIAQEAVHYLLKAGEISRITIECALVDSLPTLSVTGEGMGLGGDSLEGVGLMHSRARMIGAEISFKEAPGGGLAIVCALKAKPISLE